MYYNACVGISESTMSAVPCIKSAEMNVFFIGIFMKTISYLLRRRKFLVKAVVIRIIHDYLVFLTRWLPTIQNEKQFYIGILIFKLDQLKM